MHEGKYVLKLECIYEFLAGARVKSRGMTNESVFHSYGSERDGITSIPDLDFVAIEAVYICDSF